MVRFPCPTCGKTIKAPDEMIGYTSKCECGEIVRVPSPNPLDEAMEDRPAPKLVRQAAPIKSAPVALEPIPTGEMILCYACKKQVADNALACPKCGAIQTPEGRAKGRQLKKTANIITAIILCVLALPFVSCFLGGMFGNKNPQAVNSEHPGWDMEKLRRDSEECVRDPSKTMFVPSDGSQPYIVPNRNRP